MKDHKGRWLPGQSGNPKGSPRTGLSIAELCRGQVEKRGLIEKLGAMAAPEGDYERIDYGEQLRAILGNVTVAFSTVPA